MQARKPPHALSISLLCLIASGGCLHATAQEADLLLRGGNIITLHNQQPRAESVAIRANKIVFVGNDSEAQAWLGKSTELIDLNGRTVIPGIIESHAHFYSLGQSKQNLDLSNAANYDELVAMVHAAVEQAASGDWIVGRGWHQSKWSPQPSPNVKGFQTHQKLSAVSPNNPVYLVHASGHAAFANDKAMSIAGINRDSEFTDGGEIIKNERGEPTGVFTENASGLIARHIGTPSPQQRQQAYRLAMDEALRYGITGFHDAGSSRADLQAFQTMGQAGQLKLRLYSMIDGHDSGLVNEWLNKNPVIGSHNNFLTIRAIKMRADGALGSRGAWLLNDYTDRPNHIGSATVSMQELQTVSEKAFNSGYQMAVHAIGDRANREVLDRFAKVLVSSTTKKDHRFRIEHAQHLSLDDIPRFAELGVIASMQSIHMSSDRPWAIDRLGQQRIEDGAYVWQKLLQSGAVIVNGTDAPVEPLNPFANFYAAVTRKTIAGTPENGYEAEQKMTREQALRSMTIDAAYSAFEEDIKGSIEVGKLADLTVLSQNIMAVPEKSILDIQAVTVIVNGEVVFNR
jgi:hypothetical protein